MRNLMSYKLSDFDVGIFEASKEIGNNEINHAGSDPDAVIAEKRWYPLLAHARAIQVVLREWRKRTRML